MESERVVKGVLDAWGDEEIEGILDACENKVVEGVLDIGEHEQMEYVGGKRGVGDMLIAWEQEDVVGDEQSVGVAD